MSLLERFRNFTAGTPLRTLISSLTIALLIPITLFANTQNLEIRRRAAEEAVSGGFAFFDASNSTIAGAVGSVHIDVFGNRWFGSDALGGGWGVAKLSSDGVWEHFSTENSELAANSIKGIDSDEEGTVYFLHDQAISKFSTGGVWQIYSFEGIAQAMSVSGSGRIIVAVLEHLMVVDPDGSTLYRNVFPYQDIEAKYITFDRNGNVVIAAGTKDLGANPYGGGAYRWRPGESQAAPLETPTEGIYLTYVFIDSNDQWWFASLEPTLESGSTVYRYNPLTGEITVFPSSETGMNSMMSGEGDFVGGIEEDSGGTMWFATTSGFYRYNSEVGWDKVEDLISLTFAIDNLAGYFWFGSSTGAHRYSSVGFSPPWLANTDPESLEEGVPVDTDIVANFSSELLEGSVTPDKFRLYPESGGPDVLFSLSFSGAGVNLAPNQHLATDTWYVFEVGVGITDIYGLSTDYSQRVRFRTAPVTSEEVSYSFADLKTVVLIYTGLFPEEKKSLNTEAIRRGVERAREFYWRNTHAKLNLDITTHVLDEAPPADFSRITFGLNEDLSSIGYTEGSLDMVFATGQGLPGCYAGFRVLSGAYASFAWACGANYPMGNGSELDNLSSTTAWGFVHEFQHSLDQKISNEKNGYDMLFGHPSADNDVDANEHFSWEAATLREFPVMGYLTLKHATGDYANESFTDNDSDRMPDTEVASSGIVLPVAEDLALPPPTPTYLPRQLGTSPLNQDTDIDGLNDLEEFTAGIFTEADGNSNDTDGDGIVDGADTYPLYPLNNHVTRCSPQLDGYQDEDWGILSNALFFSQYGGFNAETYFCWDDEALYLGIRPTHPFTDLRLTLDTTGENGLWTRKLESFFININLTNETSEAWILDEGNVDTTGLVDIESSDSFTEIRVGRALGQEINPQGLSVEPGRSLGIGIFFANIDGTHKWASLFEPYDLPDLYPIEAECVPESLLPGDLDCDCDVDIVDIMKVAAIWNTKVGDPKYNPAFDFDGDGRISIADVMYVAAKWNTGCGE